MIIQKTARKLLLALLQERATLCRHGFGGIQLFDELHVAFRMRRKVSNARSRLRGVKRILLKTERTGEQEGLPRDPRALTDEIGINGCRMSLLVWALDSMRMPWTTQESGRVIRTTAL